MTLTGPAALFVGSMLFIAVGIFSGLGVLTFLGIILLLAGIGLSVYWAGVFR